MWRLDQEQSQSSSEDRASASARARAEAKPEHERSQAPARARPTFCAAEVLPPLLAGEGWGGVALCPKIKSFTPTQPPPASRGRGKAQANANANAAPRFTLASARSRAAAAHRVARTTRARSTRGPCAAVRRGRQARRGVDRDVDSFSSGQESCRKARPRLTDLPGRDARQAPSGVAFSLGYFSLGQAREK